MELFDYFLPGTPAGEGAQWYGVLTGIYWLLSPLGCFVYLVWPGCFRLSSWSQARSVPADQRGGHALRLRERTRGDDAAGDPLLVLPWQAASCGPSALTARGVAHCYGAFTLNWSSLQYADHAWSAWDVVTTAPGT